VSWSTPPVSLSLKSYVSYVTRSIDVDITYVRCCVIGTYLRIYAIFSSSYAVKIDKHRHSYVFYVAFER
jgi:hypothetical protein